MKKINILTCAMVALTMACANNDEQENVPNNYPTDNIIRVTAGVNNPMTRGGETGTSTPTLYDGDFMLTVVNVANNKYTYANKLFSYDANTTSWNCSETLLWQNAATPVKIAAVAPYDAKYEVYTYTNRECSFQYHLNSNQTTTDPKNDLLYYFNNNFTPKDDLNSDGKLQLTLNHAFCLFDINVTLGTEFNTATGLATDPIQSATISGIYNHAKIDVWDNPVKVNVITDGVWGVRENIIATPGAFTSVTNEKENAKKQFSCIVLPQTLSTDHFVVTLQTKAGKKYEWSPTENINILSGKKYTLNLSLGDNKLVLSKDGITANAWGEGTGGAVETD